MMRVLVTTSDKYLPALLPFSYLFNKYWGPQQQVLVGGFSRPDFVLPPNFEFHSIGDMNDYPVEKWSDAVIAFITTIPDEVFVLMLEDYWITRKVDTEAVGILYDYMQQFHNVIKMDLCGDRLYDFNMQPHGVVNRLDLIKSDPASQYQMSLMTGLWRKEHLLRHLVPGESPWDVEIKGTRRLAEDRTVDVLGTRQWPIRHSLAYRNGKPENPDLSALDPGDVRVLREKGYVP
jgi:hypothetical protein